MKKSGSRLFASFAAPVCAILAFIGFAFKFVVNMFMFGDEMDIFQLSFKDWSTILKGSSSKLAVWKASRVLMIILLVLIVALSILVVLQLFLQNKVLATTTKVIGIISLLCSIAFTICFSAGGFALSEMPTSFSASNLDSIMMNYYIPNLGPMWISLFSFLSSIFGLVAIKKPKKAKAE